MRKQNKKPVGKEEGKGHQARVAVEAKMSMTIDGETKTMDLKYDVTVTVEQIEYAVRQFAGTIARVASNVAEGGKNGETDTVSRADRAKDFAS